MEETLKSDLELAKNYRNTALTRISNMNQVGKSGDNKCAYSQCNSLNILFELAASSDDFIDQFVNNSYETDTGSFMSIATQFATADTANTVQ